MALKQPLKRRKISKEDEKTCCRRMKSIKTRIETNNDGTFAINWEAKQRDFWDDKVQVYARFKGTENYKPAKSDVKQMKVLWYASDHLKKEE